MHKMDQEIGSTDGACITNHVGLVLEVRTSGDKIILETEKS
jgi:hypothetical protein